MSLSSPPASGIVAFDWAYWSQSYPELASYVNQTQAALYFTFACQYLDNSATSPVTDSSVGGARYIMLHLLTSHCAKLMATPPNQNGPAPGVGRLSAANEGSTGLSLDMPSPKAAGQDWYEQTQYGVMYYRMSAPYRQAMLFPGPVRATEPFDWAWANNPWGMN